MQTTIENWRCWTQVYGPVETLPEHQQEFGLAWKTAVMSAPAFWYFATEDEAIAAALKLVGVTA